MSVKGLAIASKLVVASRFCFWVNGVDSAGASVCHVACGEKELFFLMPSEALGNEAILQSGVFSQSGAAVKGVGIGYLSIGQQGYPTEEEGQPVTSFTV